MRFLAADTRMLSALIGISLLLGCEGERVGELKERLKGEAYTNHLEVGEYTVGFRYLPRLLRILESSDLPDTAVFNPSVLDSLRDSGGPFDGMAMLMNISPKADSLHPFDASNDLVYGGMAASSPTRAPVYDYHFGLQGRIWLEHAGKKHFLIGCMMTNTWGITKGRTFTLVLPQIDEVEGGEPFTLVLDAVLPGSGRRKLSWKLPLAPNFPQKRTETI